MTPQSSGAGAAIRRIDPRVPARWWMLGFFALLASTGLVWIALDQAPFGGDQSQYATEAVVLFDTLIRSPSRWPAVMVDALRFKAPGIVWFGQLFVPLGIALGSVDAGLLLMIAIAQLAAFVLTYHSLRRLAGGDARVGVLGSLVVAAAPLCVRLGHEFLVEPLQLLATTYFVLIMARATGWDRARVLAHVLLAATFAVLVKASSPLFCLGPGLVALAWALSPRSSQRWGWSRPSTLALLATGAALGIATGIWYLHNFDAVRRHVAAASSGPVALYWGRDEAFLPTLAYWIGTLREGFFLAPVAILGVFGVAAALVAWVTRRSRSHDHFTTSAGIAALQLAIVLLVFSMNQSRVPRFLLAALPYCAVILGWSVARFQSAAPRWTAIAATGVQLVVVQLYAFGIVPLPSQRPRVRQIDTDGRFRAVLEGIVDRTCSQPTAEPYVVILGIEPSIMGDWPAPAPANYELAKRQILTKRLPFCRYDYLGGGFFGGTVAEVWTHMLASQARYFVTVDPDIYPPPTRVYNHALGARTLPKLMRRLRTSGAFEQEPPLREDSGFWVFRRVLQPPPPPSG